MTRKPDEWMPLHIGEYHADTTHLTRDQHGAYLLLLMAYWRRGGALPADDLRLAAIVKATPAEWRKIKPVVAEFFETKDGHWHQKRADRELAKANAMTAAKAAAGAKGAAKKWHGHVKPDGKQMAEPSNSQWQTDAPLPLPLPSPEPVSKEDTKKEPQAALASKPIVPLPVWVDPEAWTAFLDMRKKKRAPVTPRAVELLLGKLDKWRLKGHDPTTIIDASTASAWTDLYEPKAEKHNGRRSSPHEVAFDVARDICAEILADGQSSEGGGANETAVALLPARAN